MRMLVGLLAAMTVLAGGVAAQPERQSVGATEVATGAAAQSKGKRVQKPSQGKRVKTTIPPRKGKKG